MTEFVSVALQDYHELDSFDCGVASLNEWLTTQARRARRSSTAATHVWTTAENSQVLAYYAIAPHQVRRDEVPRNMTGGVSVIPCYLLGRLALDRSLHGQGLGGELLFDAFGRIAEAARAAAGRLVVVDAIDDQTAKFYQKYDFRSIKDNPRRLYIKVSTIVEALS